MNGELQGVKNELLAALQEIRAQQAESESRLLGRIKQAVHDLRKRFPGMSGAYSARRRYRA